MQCCVRFLFFVFPVVSHKIMKSSHADNGCVQAIDLLHKMQIHLFIFSINLFLLLFFFAKTQSTTDLFMSICDTLGISWSSRIYTSSSVIRNNWNNFGLKSRTVCTKSSARTHVPWMNYLSVMAQRPNQSRTTQTSCMAPQSHAVDSMWYKLECVTKSKKETNSNRNKRRTWER